MKKKILFCFLIFLGVFIIRNIYYHIVKPVFFSIITYDNPSPKFYLDLTSKYKLINSLETIVTSDYILNENHNKLCIKEKNKKLIYYGEILELEKIRNYWVCYGKIGNNNKIYFIINQKNEIEVLGTTKEELNRKFKKKIKNLAKETTISAFLLLSYISILSFFVNLLIKTAPPILCPRFWVQYIYMSEILINETNIFFYTIL